MDGEGCYQGLDDYMDNIKSYKREGYYSILINCVLFIGKYIIGITTGSVAIIADGWHSLSDTLSSVIVIAGSRISSSPPDQKHPYGHGRVEAIVSIIISSLLFLVAYEFIKKSIVRLNDAEKVVYSLAAYIVTVLSILLKEMLTFYANRIYKITGSRMMKAEAIHHRSDSLSSITVLIGIFLGKYFWWIDAVLGILISLMIVKVAYSIVRETVSNLIGEAMSDSEIVEIKVIIKKCTGEDLFSHHFHIHTYGDHKELTFHIRLDGDLSLRQTHRITDEIEKEIKKDMGYETTIHPENISKGQH